MLGWMDGWREGWINRTGSIHAVEYHTAMKRTEALTQATACMNLEHIMLSERSQMQKDTQCDSIDRKHPEQVNPERQKVG